MEIATWKIQEAFLGVGGEGHLRSLAVGGSNLGSLGFGCVFSFSLRGAAVLHPLLAEEEPGDVQAHRALPAGVQREL